MKELTKLHEALWSAKKECARWDEMYNKNPDIEWNDSMLDCWSEARKRVYDIQTLITKININR